MPEPTPSVARGVLVGAIVAGVCYAIQLRVASEGLQFVLGLLATSGAGLIAQELSGPPCPKWRGGQLMALVVGAVAWLENGYQAGLICAVVTLLGAVLPVDRQYRFEP